MEWWIDGSLSRRDGPCLKCAVVVPAGSGIVVWRQPPYNPYTPRSFRPRRVFGVLHEACAGGAWSNTPPHWRGPNPIVVEGE